jgi:hypothetical protein
MQTPAPGPVGSCLTSCRLFDLPRPSVRGCRRYHSRCYDCSGCCPKPPLPEFFPPLFEASGLLAIDAARDLLIPFLRTPSYCLSSFTLDP